MADYTLDWDLTGSDGSTNLASTSGGPALGVSVSTPTNGQGDSFALSGGIMTSSDVQQGTSAIVTFDSDVENVTFDLYDVDANDHWDDKVTIVARDADGNIVPVTFSNVSSLQTVSGNSIEGTDHGDNDGSGPGDSDTVTVTIAGPIASIEIIHDNGNSDSDSGLVGVSDLSFDLAGPVGDGIVSGTSGDDTIDTGYLGDPEGDKVDNGDAILPGEVGDDDIIDAGAGDDTILAGEGNDEVYAGHDDDFVDGGAGDDVIYGDSDYPGGSGSAGPVRESFEWDLAPDPNGPAPIEDNDPISGFTQNTGNVDVTFSIEGSNYTPTTQFADNQQKVHSIDSGSETVDAYSSLSSELNQQNECATYQWEFSEEVENISFRINDIDYDSEVIIKAYDADGNLVPLDITTGGGVTATNDDGVAGNEHIVSNGGGDSDTSGTYSALVNIAGPIARIEVTHNQDGSHNSGINITDIYFDTIVVTGDESGNDVLLGGDGSDIVYGEGGEDTLDGGLDDGDADQLFGGDDADLIKGVGEGDFVDGGSGGNDDDTLDLTGSTEDGGSLKVTITGPDSDGNGFDGFVTYKDEFGNETGTMTFENIENIVPCFTPGTMVATPTGERPVEDLRAGDKIITRDNGIQEICWTGQKALNGVELQQAHHLRPVLIRAGALGNGLPERDMMVSPNHRMLVASDRTALYFEEREVLVSAKHLLNSNGIQNVDVIGTTYIHFMFEQHQVVLANGAWTESFQPGDYTLDGMGNAQRTEIFELFPELATREGRESYNAARKILKRHEAKLISL